MKNNIMYLILSRNLLFCSVAIWEEINVPNAVDMICEYCCFCNLFCPSAIAL